MFFCPLWLVIYALFCVSSRLLDRGSDPFKITSALEVQIDMLLWSKLIDDAIFSLSTDFRVTLKRRESVWRSSHEVRNITRKVDGAFEFVARAGASPVELGLIESARHNDPQHAATDEVKSAHGAKSATIACVLNNKVTGVISIWILRTHGKITIAIAMIITIIMIMRTHQLKYGTAALCCDEFTKTRYQRNTHAPTHHEHAYHIQKRIHTIHVRTYRHMHEHAR